MLSFSFRSKTAVLFRCPYISNEHALDGMIIKLLTCLFWFYDVCSTSPYRHVAYVWFLSAPKIVWRYFAICRCDCSNIQYCRISALDRRLHCWGHKQLWTDYPLHYGVCIIKNDSIWRFVNAVLLWYIRCSEIAFNSLQGKFINEIIRRKFSSISLECR